jgi:hypothetical protein
MAFSTVPSPLHRLYQVRDDFSTFTVMIVFAVFCAAAAAQKLTSRLDALVRTSIGLLAQAARVAVLAVGVHAANLALFLLGGIVAQHRRCGAVRVRGRLSQKDEWA